MEPEDLHELVQKYLKGTVNKAELRRLEEWYRNSQLDQAEWIAESENEPERLRAEMLAAIQERTGLRERKLKRITWTRFAAAACIILALSVGVYLIKNKKETITQTASLLKNDIKPGRNQATLTLANGQKIILTKGLSGQLAVQHNTSIKASQDNIIYNAKNEDQVSYNTLTTAKGEQSPYPLVLADGTKVWLNAESSITFPTAFNQKERIVKLTGEAYFEVVHNAKQPFKVQTEKQTIEDIGTTFDVNAYTDEPNTKTTLVEGSVKVNGITLKPDQQTDGTHITTVNTEIYTAWKDGNFHFEGEDIRTIMRQLARWYDIEVIYEGEITHQVFYADISRNRNISAALKVLQNSKGVRFKIEGRRLTVIE